MALSFWGTVFILGCAFFLTGCAGAPATVTRRGGIVTVTHPAPKTSEDCEAAVLDGQEVILCPLAAAPTWATR